MKKLSARWVPRLLTVDHKHDRVAISKQCLEIFQRNPDEFLRRFITVDETSVTSHQSRRNNQNNGLYRVNQLRKKTIKSAGKILVTVFLGCMQYNSYRLPSVEANDQWRLLRLIGPF